MKILESLNSWLWTPNPPHWKLLLLLSYLEECQLVSMVSLSVKVILAKEFHPLHSSVRASDDDDREVHIGRSSTSQKT